MSGASGVDWEQVRATDFTVPDQSLAELTTELTQLLGDPDPTLRDSTALQVLTTWIERGVYDDLLPGLGDGMVAGLATGLGERGTDTVFRRSFSALVLAECVARDSARPLVLGAKILEWGDHLAGWLLAEQDVRGFVPGKGWAHAIAHGADALAVLARSPHVTAAELTVLLDVIGERVTAPVDVLMTSGEPDRLALATLTILRRGRVPVDIVEAWLDRLAHSRPPRTTGRDPYLDTGNLEAYLRALYLQVALGPYRPQGRADLALSLIEALRHLSPVFLGEPGRPPTD